MAISVLPWVLALFANRFSPVFFPSPPTSCLSRKQRPELAHPSARNRSAVPRYWKSSDKSPGRRSVTVAPPLGRQCAVTTCWKATCVSSLWGNIRTQCCKLLPPIAPPSRKNTWSTSLASRSKFDQVPSGFFILLTSMMALFLL